MRVTATFEYPHPSSTVSKRPLISVLTGEAGLLLPNKPAKHKSSSITIYLSMMSCIIRITDHLGFVALQQTTKPPQRSVSCASFLSEIRVFSPRTTKQTGEPQRYSYINIFQINAANRSHISAFLILKIHSTFIMTKHSFV